MQPGWALLVVSNKMLLLQGKSVDTHDQSDVSHLRHRCGCSEVSWVTSGGIHGSYRRGTKQGAMCVLACMAIRHHDAAAAH